MVSCEGLELDIVMSMDPCIPKFGAFPHLGKTAGGKELRDWQYPT